MSASVDLGSAREFCRDGLPHGNTKTWELVFYASTGELRVRICSTSQVGPTTCTEEPLSAYLARIGNSRQRRGLRSLLSRIGTFISTVS